MAHEAVTHRVAHTFEVEIERTDEEDRERRYQACCRGLTGCEVYAASKTRALYRIRQAISVWLDLADRQLADQGLSIEDLIDARVPD